MIMPVISVVLPFRNGQKYFAEALESLLIQSFDNFEVLLVDDGSSDNSVEIAEKYIEADNRFYLVTNQGSGLVDALNTGLAKATGEWIARMDCDDICSPDRFSKQLTLARKCGEKIVISCMVKSFREDGITAGYAAYDEWINGLIEPSEIEENIFVESPVPHPTAFFNRKAVLSEGGYMERVLPEDYELWLRLWSRGFAFRRVPKVLLRWRDMPERFSRTSSKYSLTSFYKLKARYLTLAPCMKNKEILIAGSGQAARRFAKCLENEGFQIVAFVDPAEGRAGQVLRGKSVIGIDDMSDYEGIPIAVVSRAPGARDAIRQFLNNRGLTEMKDYIVCV